MKTSVLLLGPGALVPLLATASFGAPSSIGPTGILNVPTADIVPLGQTQVMLAYDRPKVAGVGIDVFPVLSVAHGLRNTEIGLGYFRVRGGTAVKSANVKYVFGDSLRRSRFAVGALYLRGNTAETDLYLVTTQHLGRGNKIRATGGVLYQKPSHISGSNTTGMFGLEFGESGKTTFGMDYVVKDIAAGSLFGATVRVPFSNGLTWQVGVGNRSRFFTSLTAQFGGK